MKLANLKKKLTENWRSGAIGAASAVFLGLIMMRTPIGQAFRNLSYDIPFAFRSAPRPTEAVVVLMDEESLSHYDELCKKHIGFETGLARPPVGGWHRLLHAKLIKELDARGALAIVFDILWDNGWPDEPGRKRGQEVDLAFGEAIRTSRKVVLGEKLNIILERDGPVTTTRLRSIDVIRTNTPFHGHTQMMLDNDDKIRRPYYDKNLTNLAWTVAQVVGRAPQDHTRVRWLNFFDRPPNGIPVVSYHRALDPGALPPNTFSNKVVFIGSGLITTPTGTTADSFGTPHTRWRRGLTTGVELQATTYLNLVGKQWLTELTYAMEALFCLFVGAAFGYGLVLVRPWVAARYAIAGFFLITILALWLVWGQRIWFPWLVPAAVQIPVALGWSVLANTKRLYHEKEELEHTLATVRSEVKSSPGTAASEAATAVPPSGTAPVGASMGAAAAGIVPAVAGDGAPPAIPDHTMLRCIGKGAYGEVWLARDVIGSYHAVKIVYRRTFSSSGPFEREFRGIQKFTPISRSHAGLVHVLHVGRNDTGGYFYYIMEVGDDETTGQKVDPGIYSPKNLSKELLKRGKLSVRECISLGLSLAAALDHLHKQELIHRDIKPSNIIFVNDTPKFADIGLVTDLAATHGDVTYLGTEGYIAPEGPGTAGADVYSLGKVMYEASMGRDREQFPELPTTLVERPDKDALLQLNEIILKACETDPRRRYRTAAEMHEDLRKLQEELRLVSQV
jgi:CHASE2 domain-containing sensor protein